MKTSHKCWLSSIKHKRQYLLVETVKAIQYTVAKAAKISGSVMKGGVFAEKELENIFNLPGGAYTY